MDSPVGHVMQIITGYWHSQALYVAAKLELADHLDQGPKSSDELAHSTNTHGDTLFRLLRALASIAEFERERIRERVVSGMARARAQGKHVGRPPLRVSPELLESVRGLPVREAAKRLGVSRFSAQRLLA